MGMSAAVYVYPTFDAAAQSRMQRIEVYFEGLRLLSGSDLERTLRASGLLQVDSATLARIRTSVLEAAFRRGLHFADVETMPVEKDDGVVGIRVIVDEGPLLRVKALHFDGTAAIDEKRMRDVCDTRPGALFSDAALTGDIERILDLYEMNGYPFASVRVGDIAVEPEDDEALATITLIVDEGMLFTIDEITVEGNEVTRTAVIVRETRIGEGERYSADKLRAVRRRLERLQFFSSVSEPLLYVREGRGGVLLRVVEGNTNMFDGVIGYQPPRGTFDEGYVTGMVNLSFRNLFGSGRRMDARWERATQDVSELDIRYLEPWIFGRPINVQGGYHQRQQDSAYVRRALDASVSLLATSDLRLTVRGMRIDVIPSEFSTLPGLTASATSSGGLELYIDTRDNVYNPLAGIQLRNSWDGGSKRSRVAASDEWQSSFVQRLELDAAVYAEVVNRTVFAFSIHGRELRGSVLDQSDLYRLGGALTLRGYREEQFPGTRLGWINTEMRYTLGRRSFAFAFFDFAYIFQQADVDHGREELSLYREGYGVGMRLETGLGIMGVSYALGRGDSFGDGKIHFGLINEF